ncbi:MAG TPA: DMSO/selenate family reductase complex A subunit [Arsenophonus apicola]|uniref:DMSO/selenate family reductase complex A subunit n=1 Tax=Arsenophonus TaxID=637 RepID=UPI0015D8EEDF|nr:MULTISPECIES: DMSO/selenate family reductase complex A subunit [Arsenophonus]UBX28057.1 molybdopterin-dependent oxidoreductase [Arsenophonus apicola]
MTKNKTTHLVQMNRREFLQTSATIASVAAIAGSITLPFSVQAKSTGIMHDETDEIIKYSACLVNCGSRCTLKVHVKDNIIQRISNETFYDDSKFGEHQIRPCLRGRSVRWKTYNPDRLKYPMLRVGKRGEGKFKKISWDEATTLIAQKLKETIEKYGNEAIYYQYGTGSTGANLHGRTACKRLLALIGGFLGDYGTYSYAQLTEITPFVYGSAEESLLSEIAHSDLVVMFGHNLAETRMSGGGQFYETLNALQKSQAKVIIIDPRNTDSVTTLGAEWIPIYPGTDAALVAALGYVMIHEGLTDEAFLAKYCIGWDKTTLPSSALPNAAYKDYILGNGADGIAKTPEWASQLTGISSQRIIQLAREIANAKAAWISQGWGLQRTANGEQACRSIMMLPLMSGHIGRPGTNTGLWGGSVTYPVASFSLPNPVKTTIPTFMWSEAIVRGTELTAKNAGIRGKDKLDIGIKFLWCYSSNVIGNQHADLNKTHQILTDESKCEFILVWDNHNTASAKYADLLLPDVTPVETDDLINNSYASGSYHYLVRLQQAIKPLWQNRPCYDVLAEIAEKLGVAAEFTAGRTYQQWIEYCYNKTRKTMPHLPPFEQTDDQGIIDRRLADSDKQIALKDFRQDPDKYPLKTPSGKIEIYSEQLNKIAQEWQLPDGDRIPAIPEYCANREGVENVARKKQYPLLMTGFHNKGHVHSSYYSVAMLREAIPHQFWINPIDAKMRGLKQGDIAEIYNDRGRIYIKTKITNRVLPGVIAVPQGAWRNVNKQGIDVGGCINTLTSLHPSPFAKGTPQHTNLVEVKCA